jgi:hypothetical protein
MNTSGVVSLECNLGPLFLVIFINNLVKCGKHSGIILYVDDGQIFKHILNCIQGPFAVVK